MGNWHNDRKKGQVFNIQEKLEYKGINMQQADAVIDTFKKFFTEQKFDLIIELGTMSGGLTLFFAEHQGDKVHSFDMTKKFLEESTIHKLESLGASLHFQNIFRENTVETMISNKGRVLLLCDNGDKIREVKTYHKYLKHGDVIMAHDYIPNTEVYHNQTAWKSCEVMDEHLDYEGLCPYYTEEFTKVYWGSRIKRAE